MEANDYSPAWFDLFLRPLDAAQTEREAAFLDALLPPRSRVLDLACGTGRHARLLARRGHRIVGVDRDRAALAEARAALPGAGWVRADLRALPLRAAAFDAVLSLWQSFGYFDPGTNAAVLRRMRELARPGGRVVLDLYHRAFFELHPGERSFERAGVTVTERRRVTAGRLRVELEYGGGGRGDVFEWQLFTPGEVEALARESGLALRGAWSGFDPARPPSPGHPRVQYLLERV